MFSTYCYVTQTNKMLYADSTWSVAQTCLLRVSASALLHTCIRKANSRK